MKFGKDIIWTVVAFPIDRKRWHTNQGLAGFF
jgi:hypothetical protein